MTLKSTACLMWVAMLGLMCFATYVLGDLFAGRIVVFVLCDFAWVFACVYFLSTA